MAVSLIEGERSKSRRSPREDLWSGRLARVGTCARLSTGHGISAVVGIAVLNRLLPSGRRPLFSLLRLWRWVAARCDCARASTRCRIPPRSWSSTCAPRWAMSHRDALRPSSNRAGRKLRMDPAKGRWPSAGASQRSATEMVQSRVVTGRAAYKAFWKGSPKNPRCPAKLESSLSAPRMQPNQTLPFLVPCSSPFPKKTCSTCSRLSR
ncbi:hypothetical protein AWB80_07385 [Caballeronia pedi]|uniref:Uncharacterized protein n=1 Tax=Caballeronia pedi TaxID=1777141 RepID=A0A158DSQ4_9BURK|nr:hypothetical protein AWB80_07385 [Caballeronia pedi]